MIRITHTSSPLSVSINLFVHEIELLVFLPHFVWPFPFTLPSVCLIANLSANPAIWDALSSVKFSLATYQVTRGKKSPDCDIVFFSLSRESDIRGDNSPIFGDDCTLLTGFGDDFLNNLEKKVGGDPMV